jgi:predicted NBD/HSP70 family sugar kinase
VPFAAVCKKKSGAKRENCGQNSIAATGEGELPRRMENTLRATPKHRPEIDPEFTPAVVWNKAYRELCANTPGAAPLAFSLSRPDGTASSFHTVCLPHEGAFAALNQIYAERILKFLLWARGGNKVMLAGRYAGELAALLRGIYHETGARAFDCDFVKKLFDTGLEISAVADESALPRDAASHLPLGRNLDGCRIGFDLGGSDRKCAALIDGKVVFSEEVKWDPYFQSDPQYHYDGIRDSLRRAAAHLPRVDAIGGSAAGVYINNTTRVASLFRGVKDPAVFEARVKNIFPTLAREWGVPFEVLNDGDVTALAGSMSMGKNAVLGIAMGTSVAGGYVDPHGRVTNWLNELAFVPLDYRENAPADEWSGDLGCGVQYFSQQGAARLLPLAGIRLPEEMKLPERLEELQRLMGRGDPRARKVYEAVGACFGYFLAHLADFYACEHLLLMGRVASGEGGSVIIENARRVLADEFPALNINLVVPDEKEKRHGQAIAAASLPALRK